MTAMTKRGELYATGECRRRPSAHQEEAKMSDHYPADSNVGLGMVSDTPEEKEIELLSNRVKELERRLAQGREEVIEECFEACKRVAAHHFVNKLALSQDENIDYSEVALEEGYDKGAEECARAIRSLPAAPPTK